jgi:UDP-N-acetylglucosamine acyltransferase
MQAGGLASILNISDALAAIRESIAAGNAGEHVAYLPDFIANSERGIIK